MKAKIRAVAAVSAIRWLQVSSFFVRHQPLRRSFGRKILPTVMLRESPTQSEEPPTQAIVGVVAPLHYAGPYPALNLRFPDWPCENQEVFRFLLDTGASVNTVNSDKIEQANLKPIFKGEDLNLLGSSGMGGSIAVGDVYLLGDCQLEGLPPPARTFVRNLTATSLEHSCPAGDGLLGQSFLNMFAAVEFDWKGTDGDPPTVIFYFAAPGKDVTREMSCVPIKRWANLVTIEISVNNVTLSALVDTGSPVTVFHPLAAELANITCFKIDESQKSNLTEALESKKVLLSGGVDGNPIPLCRSDSTASLWTGSATDFKLGCRHVYVGDLPGLSLASKAMGDDPPQVLLGLDFLRRTYRTIVSKENIWFQQE